MKALISFYCLLIIFLISCTEEASTYVGDIDPTTSGVVKGIIVDSLSRAPLKNVEILVSDIMQGSEFDLVDSTDEAGEFFLDSLFEQNYYFSFNTPGYFCKIVLVDVKDSLTLEKPIALERHRFPYDELPVDEFPTDSTADGFYYRLDPSVYYENSNWFIDYNSEPDEFANINTLVDSVIISLLRSDIKIDTVWYKYWQADCGAALVAFNPNFVVKLSEDNPAIRKNNFIDFDFTLTVPQNCIDSTEKVLRYSFFYDE